MDPARIEAEMRAVPLLSIQLCSDECDYRRFDTGECPPDHWTHVPDYPAMAAAVQEAVEGELGEHAGCAGPKKWGALFDKVFNERNTAEARVRELEQRVGRTCSICGDHDAALHCTHCGRPLNHVFQAPYDEQAFRLATLEARERRLREALEGLSNPVYYDSHGWFICQQCGISSHAQRHPGHLAPADDPFPHAIDCSWRQILAALTETAETRPHEH